MPIIDTTRPQEADTTTTYEPLDTDSYLMKIVSAQIAESPYLDDKGNKPIEVTVCFQLPQPIKHPQSPEVEYKDRVYWRMKYFYGDLRSGGPSKFKAFIDGLITEGKLGQEINIAGEADDPKQGDLIGIMRKVMVEKYTIGQGKNQGQLGNKVLAVTAPKNGTNGHEPPSRPQPTAKPISLDDVDAADRRTRYEYLKTVFADINNPSWTQDQLTEAARDFADFSGNEEWQKKNFAARNDVQLRYDIKMMWNLIERHELATNPERDIFE